MSTIRPVSAYTLSLEIPWLPEGLNVSLNAHWRVRHKLNRAWDSYILGETRSRKPAYPIKRARISLTRHSWRMLDFDGLVGSLKPVVDALVTAGVLSDDSWNVLGQWQVDQVFRPKKEGPLLVIFIEEVLDTP